MHRDCPKVGWLVEAAVYGTTTSSSKLGEKSCVSELEGEASLLSKGEAKGPLMATVLVLFRVQGVFTIVKSLSHFWREREEL